MPCPRILLTGLLSGLLGLGLLSIAVAPEAEAQAAMKRSAGSMSRSAGSTSRSAGSRRGGLGSSTRGHDSGMASERRGSKPTFRSPDGDRDDEKKQGSKSASGTARLSKSAGPDDEEEEEPDYGLRTLGRSCMYGAQGEVIFRPAGARCRGDAGPAALDPPDAPGREARKAESAARPRPAPPTRRADPGRRPPRRPKASRPRPVPEASSGAAPARPRPRPAATVRSWCTIGPDGRMIDSVTGIACTR